MMEEWKQYRLIDVLDTLIDYRGKTPKKTAFGVPLITAKIIKNGRIETPSEFISLNDYDSWMVRGFPKVGDVVLTTEAPLGEVAQLDDANIALAQRVVTLRGKSGVLDNTYLKYYFLSNVGHQRLKARETGTTVTGIKQSELREVIVDVPPYEIQVRISNILKSLDDKIEVNRKINENLEQQAQALFKSWLKKCEDEVTIGDLSLNITDYTKCEQKQVVLINSSDVTEGRFEHHNLSENKNLKGHFNKRFQKGDILYSQVRPRNRHWGYCTFNADNYLASTQLMVIRNRPDVISSILLYQYIIENKVWMDFTLRTETRSGTFPQGNYEDLSAIKVPFGADVKEITDNLENIYSLIYKNEDESRRLAELRDTLLPKLMSGELKVNDIH